MLKNATLYDMEEAWPDSWLLKCCHYYKLIVKHSEKIHVIESGKMIKLKIKPKSVA